MNEMMIDPKPLGVHELPTSEVVPRVETEPNQFDEECGAKDAIEHAAIALDRNRKSENLRERSSGDNWATPRDADGRGTEDPTNRALTSENVTRMLEEQSQEEVSRAMGSAPSFSEDYTDATDEVSNAFSHLKITLDNSTREVNKSSLASRVPPSYSGSYRTAAVAKGAANISKEVDRDTKDTDKSSLASWERDYSEDDSTEGATDKNSSVSSQAESDFEGEKRPNWLDPRSVPAIQNQPKQVEPCLPDTFFGKLHHKGPFSYTGRDEPGEQTPLLLEEQEDTEEDQQEKDEQEDMEEGQQEKDELEDMEEGQQERDEQDEKALSQVSNNETLIASTEAEGDSDGIADVPGVFRRLPAWRRLTVVEQGEEAEEYDPEFPALSTPSGKLSAASLKKIGDMPNAVAKWLYSQSFHSVESKQHAVESLTKYSLLCYDDKEDEPQTERAPKEDKDQLEKRDISRLQLNDAIPECCLTDSVFLVDRPKDAVSLDFKLPPLSLEGCAVEAFIKIRMTHVYTPFQFWFNFVEQGNDVGMVAEMESEMKNFYNDWNPDYLNALPGCLLKPGYMCAVRTEVTWRRARILRTPPPGVDTVSIYYVDYGSHADVSAGDLRYLSTHFGELPPLAVRGTLSYIHPPDTHWPPDSMEQFHRLVIGKELFAHINEVDLVEQILFLRISQNKEFQPSINRMLVDARLAGKSLHYDPRHIKINLGRRKRYLRERLPSHEMLETGVFPVLNEEFEVEFDGIIYSPAFERFEVPNVKAEYSALREALVAWMPAYRKETEHWGRLYREQRTKLRQAQRKIREDWLAAQGKDLLQSRAEQKTDDRLVALDRKIDEATENTEKVEAMASDPVDESSEPDQDEETRREGDMDMVD